MADMFSPGSPENRSWRRNALLLTAGIGGMALVALLQRDTISTDDEAPTRVLGWECQVVDTRPYALQGETPYLLYVVADPDKRCDPGIVYSAYAPANQEIPLGSIGNEPRGTVVNLPELAYTDK